MIIKWRQHARKKGEYHIAKIKRKAIGWCIRKVPAVEGYWLGALVNTTKDIPLKIPGAHRGDYGPFVLLDAAKAALEIMYQPKEK